MTQIAEGARLTGHSGNDDIGTPQALYRWLDRRFKFNYDAAARHDTAKAETYSTIEGTYRKERESAPYPFDGSWMTNVQIDTMDGLRQTWLNRRVFVNPPYSTALMRAFLEKGIEERNNAEVIVFLVKFDPSTESGRLLEDKRFFHLEDAMRVEFEYSPEALAEMRRVAEEKATAKGKKLPANWHPAASTFPVRVAIVKPDMWRPS